MTATINSQNGQPKRQRRAWTPGDKDHLIYQWVKFDGQTQARTAADFGISQATVSRIIDRYERWQAHADEREGGRLDPAERRRAQRWLTYERNERILASALRIADRMEGVTELHKSVRTKPQSEWYKEGTEIRSEERGVDRHGVAARFLRLAFRINMEQLKLVEQDPPPMPEPLTAVAEEEGRAAGRGASR
jgi:transcription initiation factor TFIIIB Brf1 subunit/transcription initiation factor TFIIB